MGAIKKLVFAGGLVVLSSLSMAAPVAVDPGSTFVLKMVKPIELNASVGSVTSAPTTCSSRTIMWSGSASCSASVPAMSNGSTRTLNDTTGKIGSATVSCNAASNAITVSGGSSCTDPVAVGNRPCSAQAVSWGACTASAPARNHGQNSSISDSTAPSTGSATFTCNDSSFVYSSGNCSTAATTCTNKAVNWSVAGNACSALSGVTNDGANKTVSNTASNGNTGNATFTCTASSDTYSLVGSPTCAPPPATACTSQTLGWNVGGTSCASNSGSVNNGVTTTLASTNGNSGSAQFTCNASTNTFSQTGTPTCAVPPPSSCTSQSKTWGTAPSDCAALTGTTTNGASRTISNTASNGNSGSATYVCNASTDTYTVSGTPTCSQPAPSACTSQTKSWGTAPANCSAVTGATNNSVSKTVANTLNANSGSATYICNAATDTYTVSGTPTCTQPAPTSCTSQTKTWSAGGNSCSGSTGATNNSVSKTVANTLNANTGSATYTCNAATDTYTVSGTPTCAAPTPTTCTSQSKAWGASPANCEGFTTETVDGSTSYVTNLLGNGNSGEASYVCNASTNTYTVSGSPTCNRDFPDYVSVKAGGLHTCGITDQGALRCWGENSEGMLGDGTTTNRNTPTQVVGLTSGVSEVSLGDGHTCAIHNGVTKCWGLNNLGQLGNGTTVSSSVPVVVADQGSPSFDKLSAGSRRTCAVKSGAVWCWGTSEYGTFGDGERTNGGTFLRPTAISAMDGQQIAGNEALATQLVNNGITHTCVKLGETIRCWGLSTYGQTASKIVTQTDDAHDNVIAELSQGGVATKLATGRFHSCAIHVGAGKCWGRNDSGQLGDLTVSNKSEPTQVSGLGSGVSHITGGDSHTCAIHNGAAKCWGLNSNGQVGDGSRASRTSPRAVSGLTSGITDISAGGSHTCAIRNGNIACWGAGASGQLGSGSTSDSLTPNFIP